MNKIIWYHNKMGTITFGFKKTSLVTTYLQFKTIISYIKKKIPRKQPN